MGRNAFFLTALSVMATVFFAASAAISGQEARPHRAELDEDGVQRVFITAGSYFFRPARIIVKANLPVELVVKKEPTILPHNLTIREKEAGMDAEAALSSEVMKTVRFTPVKTGEYAFYCNKKLFFLKSHRERGMEGVLEVVE